MAKKITVRVNGNLTEEIKDGYNEKLANIILEKFGVKICAKLLDLLQKED